MNLKSIFFKHPLVTWIRSWLLKLQVQNLTKSYFITWDIKVEILWKTGSVFKDNKSQSSECSSFKAKTCSFFSTELVKLFCNGERNLKLHCLPCEIPIFSGLYPEVVTLVISNYFVFRQKSSTGSILFNVWSEKQTDFWYKIIKQ